MRRLTLLVSFSWLLNSLHAQQRPLPDGIYVGLRWFKESDSGWSLQRDQDPLSYQLDQGWGPLLIFSKELTDRFGATIESGAWIFRNNEVGTTADGDRYDQKAIVLPIMLGVSVTAMNKGSLNIHIDLNAGATYSQYIQRMEAGGIRVDHRTEFIYGPAVVLNLNLFRIPGGLRTGPRIGTSFFSLGGKTLLSPYGTLW
jgi:hypothetical protein